MTTADQTGDGGQTQQPEADAKLAELVSERDKLKQQLRELGKDSEALKTLRNELATLTAEKSKLFEDFEGFKTATRQRDIDTHVSTALEAAGARNPDTVRKLLTMDLIKFDDKGQVLQESVAEMITAVRTTDPYLFKEVADPKAGSTPTTGQVPDVKRAADSRAGDGFDIELAGARKAKDPYAAIEAVLVKYRK